MSEQRLSINPLIHARDHIFSEVFQILLVLERIKADKKSYQTLKTLASLKKSFELNAQQQKNANLHFCDPAHDLSFQLLCQTLDAGKGMMSYAGRLLEANSRVQRRDCLDEQPVNMLWEEEIAPMLDAHQFRFEHLNALRLDHLHFQLVLAYLHAEELLAWICEVKALSLDEFYQTERLKAKQIYASFYQATEDLNDVLGMIDVQIREKAFARFDEAVELKVAELKNKLAWQFAKRVDLEGIKTEKKRQEWIDPLGRSLGEKDVLILSAPNELFKKAFETNRLDMIASAIIHKLSAHYLPNKPSNGILPFMEGQAQNTGHMNMGLFFQDDKISCKEIIFHHKNPQLNLSVNTLLRGLGFSIWFDNCNSADETPKVPILTVVKIYTEQASQRPYCLGKCHTIKQAYEAVKGYAKQATKEGESSLLVDLLNSQMTRRLLFPRLTLWQRFRPFNVSYEERLIDTLELVCCALQIERPYFTHEKLCAFFIQIKSLIQMPYEYEAAHDEHMTQHTQLRDWVIDELIRKQFEVTKLDTPLVFDSRVCNEKVKKALSQPFLFSDAYEARPLGSLY